MLEPDISFIVIGEFVEAITYDKRRSNHCASRGEPTGRAFWKYRIVQPTTVGVRHAEAGAAAERTRKRYNPIVPRRSVGPFQGLRIKVRQVQLGVHVVLCVVISVHCEDYHTIEAKLVRERRDNPNTNMGILSKFCARKHGPLTHNVVRMVVTTPDIGWVVRAR